MNISAHDEYGLRCAVQLARSYGTAAIPASRIAEREGISVEYVSKFMHLFRKAGLVRSVRGIQGGFALSSDPREIRLQQVLMALQSKRLDTKNFCHQFSGHMEVCANYEGCSVRPLWSMITFYFDCLVNKITLQDLMLTESNVRHKIESILLENLQSYRESEVPKKVIEV